MERFRALAAILGCLAVLAGSVMTVAAAAPAAPARSGADALYTHCDDCDDAPCPTMAVACLQVCPVAAPALAMAAVSLPIPSVADEVLRSARPASLSGLSPPPDPFPPKS